MSFKIFQNLLSKRSRKPKLSVPEAYPLTPCIIEPYVNNAGVLEENRGYVPVSLLMRAIDNDRMHNIAVAGNFGVGKSSVIYTAEKKLDCWSKLFRRHRFIHISLASLLTKDNKSTKEHKPSIRSSKRSVDEITDKQIEYSILQQILYHDKPQVTPKSRIRRIHKTKWAKPLWIAFLCILTFVSFVILFRPSWVYEYVIFENVSDSVDKILKWGPLVSLCFVFFIFLRYLGRNYSFAVNKVGYKDVEVKIKEDISVFNIYLDEIVYFFESTKYDVVVFEDLDRFSNKEIIFYKLRELNTILNNSRSLHRKVNFIYAVSDDLFDAIERVKFFDYIVTVIPVINSLNSYDKLKEAIRPVEKFEKLGRTELWNLCDYLQDMRLLLNIVNEFNQFNLLLDPKVMSEKVLFGLIVYKNYVPSDFAKMYNKNGVVASLLEKTDEQRAKIILSYDNRIEQYESEIAAEKEILTKKQIELRKRYLDEAKKMTAYPSIEMRVLYDGVEYPFDQVAANPSLFQKVKDGSANIFRLSKSLQSISIPPFSAVEKRLADINGFDFAMTKNEEETKQKIEDFKHSIQTLFQKKAECPTTVEGIYQVNLEVLSRQLRKLGSIEKQQLVRFLILNGYLDRHYQYYLSYFYPNALSREDRNFIMQAARREGLLFEVKLNSLDEVIKRFSVEEFSLNESLLNVDLVREIFGRNKVYQPYRDPICNVITNNSRLDFIISAYNAMPDVPGTFFYTLLRGYDFWDKFNSQSFSFEEQETLREIYVKFCDLREGRINPRFRIWLQENYSFFDNRWDIITAKRAQQLFAACAPVFKKLVLKNTPDLLLFDIIDNMRYEFYRGNMNAIVRKLGFIKEYKRASYSAIRDANIPQLTKAVAQQWTLTLKSVFPDSSVYERDDTQCALLNDNSISKTELYRYLSKQKTRIASAASLQDVVLVQAFENSLVMPTWSNVYYYAVTRQKGLPLQFLYKNTFKDKVRDSLSPNEESALAQLIVFSDRVKLSKYVELVSLFTAPFDRIPFKIHFPRMKVLVEKKLLVFSQQNYNFLFNHYPSLCTAFFMNNLDVFIKHPDTSYSVNKNDALMAINSLSTKKAKLDFIRAIKTHEIVHTPDFVSIARGFIEDGDLKVTDINHQLLLSVIADAPASTRVTIGRRAIISLDYDRKIISDILNAIGGDYRRLTTATAMSTIAYSMDSIKICNKLVSNGYIAACEKKDKDIIIRKKIE